MIINTVSDLDLTYCNYVAECEILDKIYDTDSDILSESTDILNEQLNVEKIKDVLNMLMENIANLFAKFVEWAKRKIGDDSGFLRYYKKTITETPLIEDTFTMYPYWLSINEILSATVPSFNYLQLKDDLDSDEDFIDAHFKKYADASLKSTDIVTGAKILFRGKKVDPVPIKSSAIPMQRIYNFCVDFENVIKRVESDLRKIDKSAKECIAYSKRLSAKIEQQNRREKVEKEEAPATANHEHVTYTSKSYFGKYAITESDVVIKSKQDKENSNPDGSVRDSVKMSNISSDMNDINNNDAVSKENPAKDIERIKRYLKICSNFLGAKLAVLQEQYNAYMFIFRHHVNSIKARTRKDSQSNNENNADKAKANTSTDGGSAKRQNKEKEITLFGRYKTKIKS